MDLVTDPFSTGVGASNQARARASAWPVGAALGAVTLSVMLVPVGGRLAVGLAGYFLAALLAPVFVVIYRVLERRAQQSIHFTRRQPPRRAAALAIVLGLAVGATHAWMIATEIAKR